MLLQPVDDPFVGIFLAHSLEAFGDHRPVGPDDGKCLEPVIAADVEVDRVVAWGDLEGARAELRLDAGIGDHWNAAADDGDDDLLPDCLRVPRVVRIHRDGDIREDRGRPHGRDRDRAGAIGERVPGIRQRIVHLDVLDLEVGERGLVVGAPVDDPVRTVDPPGVPEANEVRHHGLDVAVVHREALAGVVERAAELPELPHDRLAGALEPRPGALEEGIAPDRLPRGSLGDQLLLDDVLGRDAGVV